MCLDFFNFFYVLFMVPMVFPAFCLLLLQGICVAMPIYYATGSRWKVRASREPGRQQPRTVTVLRADSTAGSSAGRPRETWRRGAPAAASAGTVHAR